MPDSRNFNLSGRAGTATKDFGEQPGICLSIRASTSHWGLFLLGLLCAGSDEKSFKNKIVSFQKYA
jgi:hypothetical protein